MELSHSQAKYGYDVFRGKKFTGLIADFNYDDYVGATDLQLFGDNWHFVSTDPAWDAIYDLNTDNIVDAADLQIFGDHLA